MKIHSVEYSCYDSHCVYHFSVPEGLSHVGFDTLCRNIMAQAAEEALEGEFVNKDNVELAKQLKKINLLRHIGYEMMFEELLARLPKYGCTSVRFPTVSFNSDTSVIYNKEGDTCRLLKPSVLVDIIDYNKMADKRSIDEYETELKKQRKAVSKKVSKKVSKPKSKKPSKK